VHLHEPQRDAEEHGALPLEQQHVPHAQRHLAQRRRRWRVVALAVSGGRSPHGAVFATPADFPRHDGTPYRELRAATTFRPTGSYDVGVWDLPIIQDRFLSPPCQTLRFDSQRVHSLCRHTSVGSAVANSVRNQLLAAHVQPAPVAASRRATCGMRCSHSSCSICAAQRALLSK
jgi:hypothetical protein